MTHHKIKQQLAFCQSDICWSFTNRIVTIVCHHSV